MWWGFKEGGQGGTGISSGSTAAAKPVSCAEAPQQSQQQQQQQQKQQQQQQAVPAPRGSLPGFSSAPPAVTSAVTVRNDRGNPSWSPTAASAAASVAASGPPAPTPATVPTLAGAAPTAIAANGEAPPVAATSKAARPLAPVVAPKLEPSGPFQLTSEQQKEQLHQQLHQLQQEQLEHHATRVRSRRAAIQKPGNRRNFPGGGLASSSGGVRMLQGKDTVIDIHRAADRGAYRDVCKYVDTGGDVNARDKSMVSQEQSTVHAAPSSVLRCAVPVYV